MCKRDKCDQVLHTIHTDGCGPMPCVGLMGERYFTTFIDERFHQQRIYSSSCASDTQDAQDAQDVNSHSGCEVDPTPRPEDSLKVPLRPDNVLKGTLRPVRPDAFRR